MRLFVQTDVEQRFWDKVEKLESGCWQWIGARTKHGYGRFKYRGKLRSAHKFAYDITYEATPDDTWIVRKTFCPTPGCCNPEHLMVGDRSVAISNGFRRGNVIPPNNTETLNTQGGKASRKFTVEQVQNIKKELAQGVKVSFLASRYKVDPHTIYDIKKGIHYKDIV